MRDTSAKVSFETPDCSACPSSLAIPKGDSRAHHRHRFPPRARQDARGTQIIVFPPGCKQRSPDGTVVKLALKGTPLTVPALISRRVPNGCRLTGSDRRTRFASRFCPRRLSAKLQFFARRNSG